MGLTKNRTFRIVAELAALALCLPLMRLAVAVAEKVLPDCAIPFAVRVVTQAMPWSGAAVGDGLPFAVDYKRAPTLCAEHDKRIRFKSGKTIGIWPDTGGGGPFAVYELTDGTHCLVDGLAHKFIRSEYRVDAVRETVERKGKRSWILVPDGSLGIVSASDRDLTVRTANGEVPSKAKTPVGTSLDGRRFVGMILVGGKFVAGGSDPLAEEPAADGEGKWSGVALPGEVSFALETRDGDGAHKEFRVKFKSGKTLGLGLWLWPPIELRTSEDGVCFFKDSSRGVTREARVDTLRETMDVRWRNAWIRVPDGTLGVCGVSQGGGRNGEPETYSVTVETKDGETTGTQFEPVGDSPASAVGTIHDNGKFVAGGVAVGK